MVVTEGWGLFGVVVVVSVVGVMEGWVESGVVVMGMGSESCFVHIFTASGVRT